MIDFRDFSLSELENYFSSKGEQKFRAKQVFSFIHKGVEDFSQMNNIPKTTRELLAAEGSLINMTVADKQVSKLDGTTKYLMELPDGNVIECVLMKYKFGNSICISTQVGCNMGCSFCASAIGGKKRDLTAGEMLGQILVVQSDANLLISNIVLMGTGEPLENYDNVLKFIEIVNHPNGINIGMRHITLSTCGLVPEIEKLAARNIQITLAISLHAPNDDIRKTLMPITLKYPIKELIAACKNYIDKTNRRITFEYALINGVNDTDECAAELAKLLRGLLCHVNLIPINKVSERSYTKSNNRRIEDFKKILEDKHIETTVRREMGSDIDAACGQLRRKYTKNEHER